MFRGLALPGEETTPRLETKAYLPVASRPGELTPRWLRAVPIEGACSSPLGEVSEKIGQVSSLGGSLLSGAFGFSWLLRVWFSGGFPFSLLNVKLLAEDLNTDSAETFWWQQS